MNNKLRLAMNGILGVANLVFWTWVFFRVYYWADANRQYQEIALYVTYAMPAVFFACLGMIFVTTTLASNLIRFLVKLFTPKT